MRRAYLQCRCLSTAAQTTFKPAASPSTTPLRMIALPLARSPELVYYYAQRKDVNPKKASEHAAKQSRVLYWLNRATSKGAAMWEKLGKAPNTNWKYKTYMRGEQLMDRIDYEEWSLKGIDPMMSPKLWQRKPKPDAPAQETAQVPQKLMVPIVYPQSLIPKPKLLQKLSESLSRRGPHHESRMKWSIAGIPLTFPFALIPIVPNFPMFYMLWRSWSHWRAWKASDYLSSLIKNDQLEPAESKTLDEIYELPSTSPAIGTDTAAHPDPSHGLLLTPEKLTHIIEAFELDEKAHAEIMRAISQVEARLRKEDELAKEKAAILSETAEQTKQQ